MSNELKRLDAPYFADKLGIVVRDVAHYTPQEMARELVRLAKVADEAEAINEAGPAARPAADAGEPVLWIDPKSNSDWRNEQPLHGDTKMVMLTGATDKFGEWSVPLYRAAPAEAPSVRDAALEEAARICDEQAERARTSSGNARADACAAAIRALQGKPEAAKGGEPC